MNSRSPEGAKQQGMAIISALLIAAVVAVIAAGMVLSRAVVRDMVADDQAASMIGYVTMGMSLVPMIGPVIGGFLDQFYGWHANFAQPSRRLLAFDKVHADLRNVGQ